MTTNRTYLITGAARGIGRGISEELAEDGANIVVNYHSSEGPAYETIETLEADGANAIAVQADVTDKDDVSAMRDRVHDEFGSIDVLINNAGITSDVRFDDMTAEEWQKVLDVHLGGAFNVTKEFFDDLKQADEGRLINISSVIGKQGNFGQANYATAKSGLFGFTRTMALELASSGTTANCVAPGYTRTDMVEGVREDIKDRIKEDIPLNRFAEVEEIAAVVRFIASEDASYISGEVLDVNGAIDL